MIKSIDGSDIALYWVSTTLSTTLCTDCTLVDGVVNVFIVIVAGMTAYFVWILPRWLAVVN